MGYEQAKAFLLNFYTRYGASWVLKGLTALFIYLGCSQAQATNYAGSAALIILGTFVARIDMWHSKLSVNQAVKIAPNDPPTPPTA